MLRTTSARELLHRLIMAELIARPGEGLLARRFLVVPGRAPAASQPPPGVAEATHEDREEPR